MSYLSPIDEADATGPVAQMYDEDRSTFGYVANLTKAFSHRPDVFAAWKQLNGSVKANMDLRRYEIATLAAARRLRSSYCAIAHGKILAESYVGEQGVRDLMGESVDDGPALDPLDAAITRLAETITDSAAEVTESDYDELRALGLADDEILDIVLAVALRCFFSTVLDATGTRADHAFETKVPSTLHHALTVGRPIADR